MIAVSPLPLYADQRARSSPPGLRALLIAADPDEALRVSELLADLAEPRVELAWAPTGDIARAMFVPDEHDLYLLDWTDSAAQHEHMANLRIAASAAPLIAIVAPDDDYAEQAALDAGATDTLPRGEFDEKLLARTIRRR
jgi:DNA-binding response OmpR family regulator